MKSGGHPTATALLRISSNPASISLPPCWPSCMGTFRVLGEGRDTSCLAAGDNWLVCVCVCARAPHFPPPSQPQLVQTLFTLTWPSSAGCRRGSARSSRASTRVVEGTKGKESPFPENKRAARDSVKIRAAERRILARASDSCSDRHSSSRMTAPDGTYSGPETGEGGQNSGQVSTPRVVKAM